MAARKKGPAKQADQGIDYASFAEAAMDTSLYGVGAYFCDQHPDLVDDVLAESRTIETDGLKAYAEANELSFDEGLQTLLTGLAVRYYKAIVG